MLTRLLALTLLAGPALAAASDRVYGYAYDLDGGQYLYTEVHDRTIVDGKVTSETVRYVLPDGSELGRKSVDYQGDPLAPLYRLDLPREGYSEAVTANAPGLTMMRQGPRDEPETATIAKDGPLVADAGMMELLLQHFDALMRGETLSFRVAAPSRLSSYRFRAHRMDGATVDGQRASRIEVEMDSMLKLFAGPLIFTFDAGRKLLEFRGPTDVRNPATGKEYAVRLVFPANPPEGVLTPK